MTLHFELKVQYAHEMISAEYGIYFADDCIIGEPVVLAHARNNPRISVKALAKFAMNLRKVA